MSVFTIPLSNLSNAIRLLNLTDVRGENECWFFEGHIRPDGYGRIKGDERYARELAHRYSYQLFKGDPGDKEVMHSCDVRCCVNPAHLSLGTHQQNMADCSEKERNRTNRPGNGYLKVGASELEMIVKMTIAGANQTQIGRALSISPNTVRYHQRKNKLCPKKL